MNLTQLQKFAHFVSTNLQMSDIITLKGDLGSGKTTLVRMIIQHLIQKTKVLSPTFNLLKIYNCKNICIWHFDFYRISCLEEALETGLFETLENKVTIIEWPEIVEKTLPVDNLLKVEMQYDKDIDKRNLSIEPGSSWSPRLKNLKKFL